MSCERYEVLLRLAPASLLGLEERKQLEKHFKECPACTLKSRELQLSYSALKAPLEPYKLDEDRIFEGILEAQNSQPLTRKTKPPSELKISLSCCYCHDKLARAEAVYCASCLSPHHRDCFKDHGLCSAIGCQERQTVTPLLEIKARPRRSRRRVSLFLGSALAVSATLVASYTIHELYGSSQEAHASLANAEFELLQKEESLQQSRLANTQLLLKSGEVFKKERETRRQLQAERSRGVILKAKSDALESERQSLKSTVQSLELRRRELNLALGRLELKQAKNQSELEQLRPMAKLKQRLDSEVKRLRAQNKALRERGEFELRYFEQQLLILHGRRSAEDIARAGRLPELLRKLDTEMSSRRVPIIDEIAKIGPSATYAITPLIKRLKDSLQVRLAAIAALQSIGPVADKAVAPLRQLYQGCEDDPFEFEAHEIDRLRESILKAFGDFGPAAFAALPELRAGLRSDKPGYRRAALQSLTKLATRKKLREGQEQAIRQSLRGGSISLDFDEVSMEDALQYIGEFTGVKIVSSRAFRESVKNRQPKISLRLKLISVSNALKLVIGSHERAEFKVSGGRIVVFRAGESLKTVEAQLGNEEGASGFRESVIKLLKTMKPDSEGDFAKELEESLKKIEAAAKSE